MSGCIVCVCVGGGGVFVMKKKIRHGLIPIDQNKLNVFTIKYYMILKSRLLIGDAYLGIDLRRQRT